MVISRTKAAVLGTLRLLHRADHVTVSHFFLGSCSREICCPSYDLRSGSAEHGCLCSIITWTSSTTNMDDLPTSCLPVTYRLHRNSLRADLRNLSRPLVIHSGTREKE